MTLRGRCRDLLALLQAISHKLKRDLRASMCRASCKPIKGIYTGKLVLALLLPSLWPARCWQSCRGGRRGQSKANSTDTSTSPS